ncbi:hypothetical protein [Burkholderia ambifaria]|nr:hypothetical protein [Burkholderia ambifaria]
MTTRSELEQRVDSLLAGEVDRILTTVPYAGHLISEEQALDDEYYIRHRIETIKRIVLTARIDALALARMIEEDYESSRLWGRYTADELNHDLLFRRDLHQHGCSNETIDGTLPLVATQNLIVYLSRRLEEIGSLTAVAYSLFVEWNSDRVSARVVNRAEHHYSAKHVLGARSHVHFDKNASHYAMILDIMNKLVGRLKDENALFDTLKELATLFCAYFQELHDVTIGQRAKTSSSPEPAPSERAPDVVQP